MDNSKLAGDLEEVYSRINLRGMEAILNGQEELDPILKHLELDNRLGLTLLVNPSAKIAKAVAVLAAKIRELEPAQYFYPETDLHVTYLDIISARNDFRCDPYQTVRLIKAINGVIRNWPSLTIYFKGLVASKGAILVKGYYNLEWQRLRAEMRQAIADDGLEMEERYHSLSAHMTMVRFKDILRHRAELVRMIQGHSDFEIGSMRVGQLELVIHDWYNRKKRVVHKFFLKA